jgi:hypothetical protein
MIDCELFKSAQLLRFESRSWGNTRKADLNRGAIAEMIGPIASDETPEQYEERITKAQTQLRASKKLVDSPAYKAVTRFQNDTRSMLLKRYANQSFFEEGWYVVKNTVIKQVNDAVDQANEQLRMLVDAFLQEYGTARATMETTLGAQFNSDDYPLPEIVGTKFFFAHRWIQLSVPEGLPPEIRIQEEEKLRKSFADAQAAITGALWAEFSSFIGKIKERLTVGDDGKKKIFRDTLFSDLVTFIGSFSNRDTFNDARLNALVQEADRIVRKVAGSDDADKAEAMRTFDGLRKQTADAFTALETEVSKAIAEEPSRSFSFDDE